MKNKSIHFLIISCLLVVGMLPNLAWSQWASYNNNRYHITFIYPSTWARENCIGGYKTGSNRLCVGFQSVPMAQAKNRDYDILFELQPLNLEMSLQDDMSFEKVGNKWIKHSQFGDVEAKLISRVGWQGIYVAAPCDKSKNYPAGECLTAILSDGHQSVIFETSNAAATTLVLQFIVPSFNLTNQ